MKLASILIMAIAFTQCASMKFSNNPPFKVASATYTHVMGGRAPGNASLDLRIAFTAASEVVFEKVYFQNKIVDGVVENKGGTQYLMARYKDKSSASNNMTLHKDAKEEFGNKVKETQEKFPFELKDNEAIISYKENGKTVYYKVTGIKKEKSVFMQ